MCKLNIKRLIIISLCTNILTISCDKNKQLQDDTCVPHKGVSASIDGYNICRSNTKTSYLGVDNSITPMWQMGDEIGVLPMDGKTTQSNFRVYSTQSQGYSANFDGGMWAIKDGHQYAAYYPLNNQVLTSRDRLTLSFLNQEQQDKSSPSHISQFDYMYANAETAIDGAINLKFRHKISVLAIQMSLPAGNYKKVEVTSDENWFAEEASLSLDDGTLTAVSESLSNTATLALDNISLEEESSVVFYVAVCPTESIRERSLEAIVYSSSSVDRYTISIPETFVSGTIYNCIAEPKSHQTVIDLSKNGTANCYIVTGSGLFSFKPVKGNTSIYLESASSAEVLWESFGTSTVPSVGDLVYDVSVIDGMIRFSASDRKGNAVIAAKDASGTILWSWHIWLSDQPQNQVYNNNAGTMMDRNLGATSAIPGDVQSLGLHYQWGRKDPFLSGNSISTNTQAASTITWPNAVSSTSSTGTTAYAVSHPTTFIGSNSSNYDWYYTGNSSTDNTRWQTLDKTKGLYDPCPPGYRVPDGGNNGVWAAAFGVSGNFTASSNSDSIKLGMDFGKDGKRLGSASSIWYPSAGNHSPTGSLVNVGWFGRYWSCTNGLEFLFNISGSVRLASSSQRAAGQSVRCILE